jgi:geranylgeranyl pyrophosphate synthase
LAFQIRDDLLGIWGTEVETGKTPADDVRRRKQTLPILELRREATEAERTELDAYYAHADSTETEVAHVLDLLDRYHIRTQVEEEIRSHHQRASDALARVIQRGSNDAAHQLYALLDGLEHRTG